MKTIQVNYSYEIPKNYTGIIEWPDGSKEWHKNGLIHRTDGPAIEFPVEYLNEYWINDTFVTKEAWEMFNWLFPEE